MIGKLRTLLREWLGVIECEEVANDLRRDALKIAMRQVSHDVEIKRINEHIFVGVDHHQKAGSWAVVCVEGKVNIVKFYKGSPSDMREFAKWLKQWEKSNLIVDTHPQLYELLQHEMVDGY